MFSCAELTAVHKMNILHTNHMDAT